MKKVKIYESKIIIPTYPEPSAEEMPMFAENRVHQRSSGRPYPNKVVLEVNRSKKENKEYKLVTLENEYVKIEILPEIGGRIYSAYDKTTKYDYFYKQHVIKPALIGVLGSWISGGVEFNWPFHHRASGFMPCDFVLQEYPDGSAACHLSEHDPIDRMKGYISIILRPGETSLETKMRLYNRTESDKSFLWWENAAVPVNEEYQIFFPQDVDYVNFHYLKSRTTYPIAGNGVFNGIPMDTDRDISWHKNTRQATSYFACASDYDFFGGYDHGKECGVVHIGDHHISPGKKMFTWAYCQLSKSWENALTDTDGEYAELMAGSYSDNQPNFSWLAPYETKEFSQHWYPISRIGAPTFANLNCAIKIDRENSCINIQSTKIFKNSTVKIFDDKNVYTNKNFDLFPDKPISINHNFEGNISIMIICENEIIGEYKEQEFDRHTMPPVITDMPYASDINDADELYLAGVHVDQYRDPHTNPDAYWKEALKRKPNHLNSLISMAKYELNRYCLDEAEDYIRRAINVVTQFNERVQSGDVYYTYGRILESKGEYKKAYDYYYKAYWAADSVAKAMTRISVLDIRNKDYKKAVKHAQNALDYGANNNLATACLSIALIELGETDKANQVITKQLSIDKLDHLTRFIAKKDDFYSIMDSDAVQTCLDIAFDLYAMGRTDDIKALLEGLEISRKDVINKALYYTMGYFCNKSYYEKALSVELGKCYPHRYNEIVILNDAIKCTNNAEPKMLLGCLYYNKLQYEKAISLWEDSQSNDISKRNLAVAYFSHANKSEKALDILTQLVNEHPSDQEMLYELIILMDKMCVDPKEKIKIISSHKVTRDDILTELSKAYNQCNMPDKAIDTLMSHNFVPCEGGEHAIADQYMFAYLLKGCNELQNNNYIQALELFKKGQILPQSLGAGIWNHCKLVPLKYHEALCYEYLGEIENARDIFTYISKIEIEYFSNMHLKELPYWQVMSLRHLGENTKAQHLLTKYIREWNEIQYKKDNGYFGTTPFFIPFVDDPQKLRKAQYCYLMGLCKYLVGEKDLSDALLAESVSLNNENLYAILLLHYDFDR